MKRRPGVTLMEVLVAITICSIGLLALLTLFPLGALEMAQSIKDDRCGHIKHNIAAIANIWGIRSDPDNQLAMLNPGGGLPVLDPANISQGDSLSYPVLVDPNGWMANYNAGDPNWTDWVAGRPGLTPRRTTLRELHPTKSPDLRYTGTAPYVIDPQYMKRQRLRWAVSLDDLLFPREDEANIDKPCPDSILLPVPQTSAYERNPRYSYGFLLQMPKVRLPGTVDLTVVIYSNRPIDDARTGETPYSAYFSAATNTISLSWGPTETAPDIGIGTWLLDAGMAPLPRGRFHRVVGVTVTGPNSMDVEVLNPPTHDGPGIVVVMDSVIEVYDRGDY